MFTKKKWDILLKKKLLNAAQKREVAFRIFPAGKDLAGV